MPDFSNGIFEELYRVLHEMPTSSEDSNMPIASSITLAFNTTFPLANTLDQEYDLPQNSLRDTNDTLAVGKQPQIDVSATINMSIHDSNSAKQMLKHKGKAMRILLLITSYYKVFDDFINESTILKPIFQYTMFMTIRAIHSVFYHKLLLVSVWVEKHLRQKFSTATEKTFSWDFWRYSDKSMFSIIKRRERGHNTSKTEDSQDRGTDSSVTLYESDTTGKEIGHNECSPDHKCSQPAAHDTSTSVTTLDHDYLGLQGDVALSDDTDPVSHSLGPSNQIFEKQRRNDELELTPLQSEFGSADLASLVNDSEGSIRASDAESSVSTNILEEGSTTSSTLTTTAQSSQDYKSTTTSEPDLFEKGGTTPPSAATATVQSSQDDGHTSLSEPDLPVKGTAPAPPATTATAQSSQDDEPAITLDPNLEKHSTSPPASTTRKGLTDELLEAAGARPLDRQGSVIDIPPQNNSPLPPHLRGLGMVASPRPKSPDNRPPTPWATMGQELPPPSPSTTTSFALMAIGARAPIVVACMDLLNGGQEGSGDRGEAASTAVVVLSDWSKTG
ncbi:uncharacterized protein KY384_001261 [Bacidia gigantensis]|uniref:uncharacterized protein n=1 Tax=Bacidia gigantensis TaxID=2732470 RepID=UPI001D043130|nr:uncharacterized protein KY384_001261 [Bacidia gigantensis]KAG8534416.1 hypothetical protein KY384_001261 [Bacidia gigantensis]